MLIISSIGLLGMKSILSFFVGSLITCGSFVAAHYFGISYLLFSLLGLFINWFGDSLDGRLAYYRNKPRKWFGFTLDLIVDWLGTILMGLGFMVITLICMVIVYTFATGVFYLVKIIF